MIFQDMVDRSSVTRRLKSLHETKHKGLCTTAARAVEIRG